eukprot:4075804-Prymnesium_polylepis.1
MVAHARDLSVACSTAQVYSTFWRDAPPARHAHVGFQPPFARRPAALALRLATVAFATASG